MKNPKNIKRIRNIVVAAIWGVVVFEFIMWMGVLADVLLRHEHLNSFLYETCYGASMDLSMLIIWLEGLIKIKLNGIVLQLVCGLLGAIIFASISAFRQYIWKGDYEFIKNPDTRKNVQTELRAAFLGAIIFDVLTFASNMATYYDIDETFLAGILQLPALPSAVLLNLIGQDGSPLKDQLIVNGLLGAIIFELVRACWHFFRKHYYENKK